MNFDASYEIVIIGAGSAGLAAAIYTSRAGYNTMVIEKENLGGKLMDREMIENYPGYSEPVFGPELGSNMAEQATSYGAQFSLAEIEKVAIEEGRQVIGTGQGDYASKVLIIASGSHAKKLNVPGEDELSDKGVFYCATCDGPRFTGKTVAVAGGGDSGLTEALLLSRLVSKVYIVELLPELSASKVLRDRVAAESKIEVRCGVKIQAILGTDHVEALEILNAADGQKDRLELDGILVQVGLEANTDYLKGSLPLDERGQILVNEQMETEIGGVFAAGDVRHGSPMQVGTAVGDGITAALAAGRYLQKLSP